MSHVAPAAVTIDAPERDARRWLALVVVVSAAFMVIFDQFVVNVAIPTMQRRLHARFARNQFVIAGYALASALCALSPDTASLLTGGGKKGSLYGFFVCLGWASFRQFAVESTGASTIRRAYTWRQ
ncbi:MAG TPA: hypothetical protein VIC60_11925 [Thermomicrobiales bacterium]